MRQKRANVNVTLRALLMRCFRVVNHGDQPVPVLPNVKDHVTPNVIRIFKSATNFRKIVPANGFHNGCPRFDLVRRIWVILDRLTQMLQRDDVHETKRTSQYVKLSRSNGDSHGNSALYDVQHGATITRRIETPVSDTGWRQREDLRKTQGLREAKNQV
jgi:hypothetical protein